MDKSSRIHKTVIVYQASKLSIGSHVTINAHCHLWAGGGVRIGDDTLIAAHSSIVTVTHDSDALAHGQKYRSTEILEPVVIGQNVWIGTGVVVLPGVHIGDNCIIAAGAVVNADIPPNCIAGGIPAKLIRYLSK